MAACRCCSPGFIVFSLALLNIFGRNSSIECVRVQYRTLKLLRGVAGLAPTPVSETRACTSPGGVVPRVSRLSRCVPGSSTSYKSCEHSHAVCCFSALFLPFGWGGVVTIQLVPASVFLLDLPRRTRRACFDCWRDRASQSCLTWPVSEDGREQSSSCFFLRLLILGCRGVRLPWSPPVSWNQD